MFPSFMSNSPLTSWNRYSLLRLSQCTRKSHQPDTDENQDPGGMLVLTPIWSRPPRPPKSPQTCPSPSVFCRPCHHPTLSLQQALETFQEQNSRESRKPISMGTREASRLVEAGYLGLTPSLQLEHFCFLRKQPVPGP